jgi:hypothetical protein
MSTKNLARTVIEGGRSSWNRWARRQSHGKHRAWQRAALDHLAAGGDPDALTISHLPVDRGFDDKLGPPRRWLARQVGRPWDLVRGELLRLFDTRTTAGRHIVFGHMLPWVQEMEEVRTFRCWSPFFVDRRGILREAAPLRPVYPRKVLAPLPRDERALEAWLGGRRVGERGPALFWFVLTDGGRYRQDRRLADEDVALWRSLPDWFRERHVPGAPAPEPRRN